MPGEGLEPTRIAPADFKSAASATSAIPAYTVILGGGGWGVKGTAERFKNNTRQGSLFMLLAVYKDYLN